MSRSRVLAACSVVVGTCLLALIGHPSSVRAQSNGAMLWARRATPASRLQRETPSRPRGWKVVGSDAAPLRQTADAETTSRSPASLPQHGRREWRIGARLQRLSAFRWVAGPAGRRPTSTSGRSDTLPERQSEFPVLQADADWDDLETEPSKEPEASAPQPEPIEPIQPIEPIEPVIPPSVPPRQEQPEPSVESYHSKDIREISPSDIEPATPSIVPEIVPVPSSAPRLREREIELFHWEASAVRNYPLYFEDMPLERYGHSLGCLQPLWSTGQFYAQIMLWPYEMGLDPPHKPLYALGYYRPGDPVERLWYQLPINPEAVIAEGAALTLFPVVFP